MQLKPFQREGAAFLAARTRALLADEPGVGKTAQLIEGCNLIGAKRVGIVCPSIGTEHWRREFQKWNNAVQHVDVISWDDAHEHLADPSKVPTRWDVLIPDESQFGKNPQARRTRSVFGPGGLGYLARRIWAASGTPAPNNVSELYPLMRAFGKTKMDKEMFTRYYCIVDEMTNKVLGNRPERIDELRAILKLFSLRRMKKDVLPELGAIDIQDWYVKVSGEFAGFFAGQPLGTAAYGADQSALAAELRGKSDEDILTFLAGDTEFSTLRRYNALLKAPAVFETVKFELENGLLDKVVVYGYHREALAALNHAFERAGIGSTLIYGDTPMGQRDAMIEAWKRKKPVLVASSIIASTVLDFTCAHQGIMLELDWVPGNNFQAMQRMHRHGQTNPVTVRVAQGTPIDEIVNGVLIRKIKGLAEIFD